MAMEILVSLVLLILGICVLVIIHIIVVGRVFRGDSDIISFSETAAHRTNNTRRRKSSMAMAIDDIKKLPSFEFKLEEEEENRAAINGLMECAVCLETFKMLEICRLLPHCKHMFHLQCIDLWLAKTAACPICRTDVGLGNTIEIGDGLT